MLLATPNVDSLAKQQDNAPIWRMGIESEIPLWLSMGMWAWSYPMWGHSYGQTCTDIRNVAFFK